MAEYGDGPVRVRCRVAKWRRPDDLELDRGDVLATTEEKARELVTGRSFERLDAEDPDSDSDRGTKHDPDSDRDVTAGATVREDPDAEAGADQGLTGDAETGDPFPELSSSSDRDAEAERDREAARETGG